MSLNTPLARALFSNALFSALCALVLICVPDRVGDIIGISAPGFYRCLGIALGLFAVDLLHQVSKSTLSSLRALFSSLSDLSWVLGSIIVLACWPALFSTVGRLILVAIAGVVLLLGYKQATGIVDLYRKNKNAKLLRYCLSVETTAPLGHLWKIISELGNIKRYARNLSDSKLIAGAAPGVGAVRRCIDNSGKSWQEECVEFETNHHLLLRFQVEAKDFPFPASLMTGGWAVMPTAEGTRVEIWWEIQPKPYWSAFILMPMLVHQIERDFPALVGRMAEDAKLTAKGVPLSISPVESDSRLIAGAC